MSRESSVGVEAPVERMEPKTYRCTCWWDDPCFGCLYLAPKGYVKERRSDPAAARISAEKLREHLTTQDAIYGEHNERPDLDSAAAGCECGWPKQECIIKADGGDPINALVCDERDLTI